MTIGVQRLAELHDRYDAILCDVWGVLHNGLTAWPAACTALARAREAGLAVVLITNSPRPHLDVIAQLDGIGVPRDSYDRIVTSGDVTRKLIAEAPKKVFFLGLERDLTLLDGLGVEVVGEAEAEAVVCTGPFDDENDEAEQYRDMFAPLVARGVPFICANPDLIVERGDRLVLCAGALAAVYAQMGGETRVTGKPYPAMYDAAFDHAADLRGPVTRDRALAIGDGLPTDVKGAMDYRLDLIYVAAGIHARDYTTAGRIDPGKLKAYLAAEGVAPTYWMPRLT
jgi:HAD superfamily hydrolase (TIGR01459 family)